jgi:malate dehydrogenase (oxaloacetate-decarboxylating)
MAKDSIIFAMVNPVPEIMSEEAKAAGTKVVGTGRSDFANQINNVLAFPGIFRGALDVRASDINCPLLPERAYCYEPNFKRLD